MYLGASYGGPRGQNLFVLEGTLQLLSFPLKQIFFLPSAEFTHLFRARSAPCTMSVHSSHRSCRPSRRQMLCLRMSAGSADKASLPFCSFDSEMERCIPACAVCERSKIGAFDLSQVWLKPLTRSLALVHGRHHHAGAQHRRDGQPSGHHHPCGRGVVLFLGHHDGECLRLSACLLHLFVGRSCQLGGPTKCSCLHEVVVLPIEPGGRHEIQLSCVMGQERSHRRLHFRLSWVVVATCAPHGKCGLACLWVVPLVSRTRAHEETALFVH